MYIEGSLITIRRIIYGVLCNSSVTYLRVYNIIMIYLFFYYTRGKESCGKVASVSEYNTNNV